MCLEQKKVEELVWYCRRLSEESDSATPCKYRVLVWWGTHYSRQNTSTSGWPLGAPKAGATLTLAHLYISKPL